MLKPNHLLLVSQLPSRPCPPVTLRQNSWILICNIFLSKGRWSPHCNTEVMIWRKKVANEISHTDILPVRRKDMQPHNQGEPIRFRAGAQLESGKRRSFSAAHFSPVPPFIHTEYIWGSAWRLKVVEPRLYFLQRGIRESGTNKTRCLPSRTLVLQRLVHLRCFVCEDKECWTHRVGLFYFLSHWLCLSHVHPSSRVIGGSNESGLAVKHGVSERSRRTDGC